MLNCVTEYPTSLVTLWDETCQRCRRRDFVRLEPSSAICLQQQRAVLRFKVINFHGPKLWAREADNLHRIANIVKKDVVVPDYVAMFKTDYKTKSQIDKKLNDISWVIVNEQK